MNEILILLHPCACQPTRFNSCLSSALLGVCLIHQLVGRAMIYQLVMATVAELEMVALCLHVIISPGMKRRLFCVSWHT